MMPLRRRARLALLVPAVLLSLALSAAATQSTLIEQDTGQDCTIDQSSVLYALPNLKSAVVVKTPELTQVHILGGQEFGQPVAFPHTEEEFARVWLHVRTSERKVGWTPAGVVDCGD
jgi:hypothetical protein